jgi:hypothetical protein
MKLLDGSVPALSCMSCRADVEINEPDALFFRDRETPMLVDHESKTQVGAERIRTAERLGLERSQAVRATSVPIAAVTARIPRQAPLGYAGQVWVRKICSSLASCSGASSAM